MTIRRYLAPGATATAGAVDANGVNVQRFGLVGDGTTDNSAALLAALEDPSVAGQRLWFPAGDYLLDDGIDASGVADVTLMGSPGARLVCGISGADITLLQLTAPQRVTIEGLTFVLPIDDLTHFSYALRTVNAVDLTVRDCTFLGGSSGLRVAATGTTESQRITITGNRFADGAPHPNADKAAAAVMVGGNARDVVIANNLVEGFREEGIAVDHARTDGVDAWIYNASVTGNVVRDCGRNGINLRKVKIAAVTGNVVTGCGNTSDTQTADGINVHTEQTGVFCEDITITGNTVSGCEAGIGADNCTSYVIAGNIVTGTTAVWAIHVGISQGSITGNTIRGTHSGWWAISVSGGRGHMVTGNMIDSQGISDGRGIRVSTAASKVMVDANIVDRIPDTNNALVIQSTTDITMGTNPTYTP